MCVNTMTRSGKVDGAGASTAVDGGEVLLRVEGVTKSFASVRALRGASLEVRRGEIFGLLGPNGAGKSTLMHILTGLLKPDGGTLDVRAPVGLAPQQIALYLDLTAWANIGIFGGLHGLDRATLARRGEELLRLANLWERRHDRVKTFSGGMQRRLNLVVSLLHDPPCLLCDEPTTGVDPQSRNALFDLIEERNRAGLTVIYTTHYMEEAERLCHRIGIIDHGKLLAAGTRDELVAKAHAAPVYRFFECPRRGALRGALDGRGKWSEQNGYVAFTPAAGISVAEVGAALRASGFPDTHFEVRRPSLEQVFLELTGKELRE